jgi:DNA invertase Pin-like site-specific DNA recombinase
MSKEKKAALKGRKVFVYSRVSTDEQKGTLPKQTKAILTGLKQLGFTGKPDVYEEQASGTQINRPILNEMIAKAKASKKPAVIVVRDIQRFTRDPYDLGELYNPLKNLNIPVMSINEPLVLGTKKLPAPSADLLAPILVAAGGSEVNTRKLQTIQGVAVSKAKGIKAGSPIELYPEEALNPLQEALRLVRAGVGQSEGARRTGKSTSWYRKQRSRIENLLLKGGEAKLNEWYEVMEMIRNMEIENGRGIARKGFKTRVSEKMKAVRRMTSGYENQPFDFTAPTDADLMEYFTNFNLYKPKRSK